MASGLDIAPAVQAQANAVDKLIQRLTAILSSLFRDVDKYNPQAVERFTRESARLTYEAQRAAAGGTSAYLDAMLRALNRPPGRVQPVRVDLRGIPQERVAERQVIEYRWLLSDAQVEKRRTEWLATHDDEDELIEPPDFGVTPEAAEKAVLDRVARNAHDDVRLADRVAADDAFRAAGVTTYRRVIHPELSTSGTCGMCIVASDRVYNVGTLLPIHNLCKCTVAAITEDDDPGHRINKADLRRLYADADGNDRSSLKRTRYHITEHGELGPVLVPQRRNKKRSAA